MLNATTQKRRAFHPARPAYEQGWLDVGSKGRERRSQHRLYYEVSGNPDGIPVVFLHGGPGGSTHPSARRFFSASAYRLIMFDQRGCGRSEPHCCLEDNNTQDLIRDLEALRKHLEVESWLLFGGSWGSTLALAYAQDHPSSCLGLVLRGLFLGRQSEIDWFLKGSANLFPEVWHAFAKHVDMAEQQKNIEPEILLEAYWDRLVDPNFSVRLAAARAWSLYESSLVSLIPNKETRTLALEPDTAMPVALMEAHYFRHQMFLEPNQLIRNIDRIRHLPAILVHGRYDLICPVSTVFDLRQVWPELDVHIIPDAAHASSEPGIATALMNALDGFAHSFMHQRHVSNKGSQVFSRPNQQTAMI